MTHIAPPFCLFVLDCVGTRLSVVQGEVILSLYPLPTTLPMTHIAPPFCLFVIDCAGTRLSVVQGEVVLSIFETVLEEKLKTVGRLQRKHDRLQVT